MARRRWFELHSWIGVITGLVMFLICWSGTVAVFAHEIDWLLDARLRAPAAGGQASWGALHAAVRERFPDATNITLSAPLHPGFAAQAVVDTPRQPMLRVWLDPTTAAVQGHTSYFNVQRFFRSLHMSLFDLGSGRGWGYWLVGAFGVLLLVTAIAPLVFYRRWWRGFLKLETRRGARVLWSDVHKLCGVWSLAFSLLIALTSVWYLSEWFGVDFGYPEPAPVDAEAAEPVLPVDALVAAAERAWPGLRITSVGTPEGSYWGPVLYAEGQTDALLVRDRANFIMVDAVSGRVLRRQGAADVGWPARWVDTADPLHFGDFGGLVSKTAWFLFGLLLSALSLTGAWLHAQRLQRSQRAGWTGTAAALCATALLLCLTAWAGWLELRSYGPIAADGQAQLPTVPVAVACFLAGWIALTVAIMAVWAWLLALPRAVAGTARRAAR